jgi:hypothetical protein
MAFTHGRKTVVKINNVDLSVFQDSTEMSDGVDTHDVTTYGAARKAYAAGLGDGTFSIGGTHDNGLAGPRAVIKPLMAAGNAVEYIYRQEGTGSGLPESRVFVIIKSYKDSSPVADMCKWTAELQMTGDLTEIDQP